MADDTKKGGDTGQTLFSEADSALGKTTDATKKFTQSTADAVDEQEALLKVMERTNRAFQDTDENLKNVSLREQQAATQKEKLTKAAKDYITQLAREVSLYTQLQTAVSGFVGKLKTASSLNQHYTRMLGEVDAAQTTFLGSVNASTSGVAGASKELQRHIDTLRETRKSAHELSSKYRVDIKVIDQVNEQVWGKFGARLMATGNAQQRWRKTTEAAFVAARTAGISSAEAMDFMSQRAMNSNKSINELNKDMGALAVVTNQYKESLKKLGTEAIERMAGSVKYLAQALLDLNNKFDHGAPNVALYGQMQSKLMTNMTALGASEKDIIKDLGIMNSLYADMSKGDLQNFVGTLGGMKMIQEGGEDLIVDPKIRAKFKAQMDAARKRGADNLELMRTAIQASAGDIGAAKMLTKLRREVMGERLTREEMRGRGMSEAGITAMEQMVDNMDTMVEQAKKGDKTIEKDQKKLQDLMSKGSSPQQKAYDTVVKIREHTQKIERLLQQSLAAGVGIGLGGMAIQGLSALGGGKLLGGAAAKLGFGKVAGGAARAPMLGGMLGGGGLAGAAATGGIAVLIGITLKHLIDRHGKEIFAQLKDIGKVIWESLKPVVDVIKMVIGTVSEALKPVADVVGEVIKSALSLIKPMVATIGSALKSVASALKPVVKVIGSILVPVLKVLAPVLKGVVKVAKVILTPAIWALSIPFKLLAVSAKGLGWAFGKLHSLIKPIIDGLRSVADWVYTNVLEPIGSAFKAVWNVIGPTVKKVGSVMWKAGKMMFSIFGKVAGVAWKVVKAFNPVALAFKAVAAVGKGLYTIFKKVKDIVMWIYNKTIGKVKKAWKWTKGKVKGGATWAGEKLGIVDKKTESLGDILSAGFGENWEKKKSRAAALMGTVPSRALTSMGEKQAERTAGGMKLSVEGAGGGSDEVSDARVDDAAGVVEIPMPKQSIKISMRSFSPAVAKMVSDATSRGTFS